jgi:predicted RNase H-like HicB family nuclease
LKGCHTWGGSYEHLLKMLQDAVQAWLEVTSENQDLETDKQLVELSI